MHERPCPDELAAKTDDYFPKRFVSTTAPSESGPDGIGPQRPAPSVLTKKNAELNTAWLAPPVSKSRTLLGMLAQEDVDWPTGRSVQSS